MPEREKDASVCHICGKRNDEPGEMYCSGAHPLPLKDASRLDRVLAALASGGWSLLMQLPSAQAGAREGRRDHALRLAEEALLARPRPDDEIYSEALRAVREARRRG